MSDTWLLVMPADPEFYPDARRREKVQTVLAHLAPRAEQISAEEHEDDVHFFDCGENFEAVRCPSCEKQVESEGWAAWMSDDFGAGPGFTLRIRRMPCCGAEATLNDLIYDMPQGFARFAVSAMNYDRAPLSSAEMDALEEAMGGPVRVVYRYI